MTWPTDRPGYPLHAERDGWHWLRTPDDQTAPYEWRTAGECERGRWPSHWVSGVDEWKGTDCAYLGPCRTPAEVAAQVEAARCVCCPMPSSAPSPLADMLAEARREGMEAAAKIVAASGLNGPGYAAIILAAMAGAPKEYDHRDNSPHDMAAGSAIRSAAAGEEGT